MLSSVVIAADDLRLHQAQHVLLSTKRLQVLRTLDYYPFYHELEKLLAGPCDLVFLDLQDLELALEMAHQIHQDYPRAAIIGFGGELAAASGEDTAITGSIALEATADEVMAAVRQAIHAVRGGQEQRLLTFLPSKGGVGCSTIVAHVAVALAQEFQKKVLVLECDLRSGTFALLLNARPQGSIQMALDWSEEIDLFKWQEAVTPVSGVDFLLTSGATPKKLPEWTDYFALLEFALPRYDLVLADLPELVNPATCELVRRARLVFDVTTQEVLSLKLAERRLEELAGWGVEHDRVRLLLNRWHRDEIGREEVEKLVGVPVMGVFPNDYSTLREAILKGRLVSRHTALGQSYVDFAATLVGDASATAATPLAKVLRLLGR